MLALIVGVTTEIFVPYFLQVLHGLTPLHAGYLSALMSAGWTIGSVGGSGLPAASARRAMAAGPLLMAGALAAMFVLVPTDAGGDLAIASIGVAFLFVGLGIGLCWPHLGARVFTFAASDEKELAAASMTVVIMVSNAIGSALGGMVTNLAGMIDPGGVAGGAGGGIVAVRGLSFLAAARCTGGAAAAAIRLPAGACRGRLTLGCDPRRGRTLCHHEQGAALPIRNQSEPAAGRPRRCCRRTAFAPPATRSHPGKAMPRRRCATCRTSPGSSVSQLFG